MAVSGNFSITNLDTSLTGGFSHRLTSIAAEGGREGGQGSTQKPGFLGYWDPVHSTIIRLHACTQQQQQQQQQQPAMEKADST